MKHLIKWDVCKEKLHLILQASVSDLCVILRKEKMEGKEPKKEQKRHQQKHSGPKAERKKSRKQLGTPAGDDERKRNPKAFAVQSAVRMAKTFHRSAAFVYTCPTILYYTT